MSLLTWWLCKDSRILRNLEVGFSDMLLIIQADAIKYAGMRKWAKNLKDGELAPS